MKKTISFSYNSYNSSAEMPDSDQLLIAQAEQSLKKAYAIYSGFQVGASVLLANGKMMSANNQENMAFPSSLCAERVLMYYCKANFPELEIKKIAVTVKSVHGNIFEPISPCGSCRQVMLEYEQNQKNKIEVLLKADQGKVYELESIKDLLPLSFKTDVLKRY
tara:strand:- start:653 stop:1141 length:489 start_codon:yes stop_codon:yes gene_type:complete